MNRLDRIVRAKIYELFVGGARDIDVSMLGVDRREADASLDRLVEEHRLVLDDDRRVVMAHPFSGVDTGHTATIGDLSYRANCAWDALAILALLGDGVARCPDGIEWTVRDGVVSSSGFIHLLVPARHFWDDVVFT